MDARLLTQPASLDASDASVASDVSLLRSVAAVVARPRAAAADSFVLHAPLELLARAALLSYVRPDRRRDARRRIAEIAESYEAFGESAPPPAPVTTGSLEDAARLLGDAIGRGELDDVDALAAWLGARARPDELPALLADTVLPLLGAAGHAPIFLWLFPRVAPRGEATATLLRPLCRELARRPAWRLRWIDEPRPAPAGRTEPADELFRLLAATPVLGRPTSTFIHPLMTRVDRIDRAGTLAPLTGGDLVGERSRALVRLAAWSMLDEPGDDAPYGWSHCLTMPQAVLGVAHACADPSRALAVAASHVYGFRASLATRSLDPARAEAWTPVPGLGAGDLVDHDEFDEALHAGAETARAVAWHASAGARPAVRDHLATTAATHHDAHLAKYVLACLDAAALDPAAERLYLAAAATLCGWWSARPEGVAIG